MRYNVKESTYENMFEKYNEWRQECIANNNFKTNEYNGGIWWVLDSECYIKINNPFIPLKSAEELIYIFSSENEEELNVEYFSEKEQSQFGLLK